MIRYSLSRGLAPFAAAALILTVANGAAAAQRTVFEQTVVRATLDQPLSSGTAEIGQPISATMHNGDLSGFPIGTQFLGIVTDVRPATARRPGTMDAHWYAVRMPNPTVYPMDGELYSLAPDWTYYDRDGRRIRRVRYDRDRWDWDDRRRDRRDWDDDEDFDWGGVAIGAGAGGLISTLTGGNFLEGALLGGLGGAAYEYFTSDDSPFSSAPAKPVRLASLVAQVGGARRAEAVAPQGSPLGILLVRPVTFEEQVTFRYPSREVGMRDMRVLGSREELYDTTAVTINGRRVDFTGARPINLNGQLYLPLDAVAAAAGLQTEYPLGPNVSEFEFTGPVGRVTHQIGTPVVTMRGRDVYCGTGAVQLNGRTYVPARVLAMISGMSGRWDPAGRRLDLRSAVGT